MIAATGNRWRPTTSAIQTGLTSDLPRARSTAAPTPASTNSIPTTMPKVSLVSSSNAVPSLQWQASWHSSPAAARGWTLGRSFGRGFERCGGEPGGADVTGRLGVGNSQPQYEVGAAEAGK